MDGESGMTPKEEDDSESIEFKDEIEDEDDEDEDKMSDGARATGAAVLSALRLFSARRRL
jgi:hypothetical protein